ncbi:MAG: hypothetical protein HC800_11560 [Phormidesmis sp. RL_2_1]|nr:hypothetical protein [Phormidesmis sp. RL_2_1]
MIGGIFETIGKTLGVSKDKYFLEIDDAAAEKAAKAAKAVVETVKEVSADVAEKAQEIAAKTEAKVDTVTSKVAAAPATEEVSAPEAAKPSKSPGLTPEEIIVNAIALAAKKPTAKETLLNQLKTSPLTTSCR